MIMNIVCISIFTLKGALHNVLHLVRVKNLVRNVKITIL